VDRLLAVEQQHELPLKLTTELLLALLRVGLESLGGSRAERAAPLGLSKNKITPLPMRKGVDLVDTRRLRRLYKTRWERAKRKRLRELSVELVSVERAEVVSEKVACSEA